MILQMVGIDHEKADMEIRELFSFHNHSAIQAMERIKDVYQVSGVVLLSTCNRTELYISVEEKEEDVFSMLCMVKNVEPDQYRQYAIERSGKDACDHLFQLACGMKSKIFGEDQIITQVKLALSKARDTQTTDSFLERVFQSAIATGKKVRTQVHLTAVQTSVVEQMLKVLKQEYGTLTDKKCMVIGNGEIGQLAAKRLVEQGADVTVTVRNYKTKNVEIPTGCTPVDYQNRYETIGNYEIIVSATTSPHHTVKYEDVYPLLAKNKIYSMMDLAVPRDISSKFAREDNVRLHNIDTLGGATAAEPDNKAIAAALSIIEEEEAELESWNNFRDYVPIVKSIAKVESTLIYGRAEKGIKKFIENGKEEEAEKIIREAAEKTISSMLFDLRKNLPVKYWKVCLEAMEQELFKEWNG